jgi:hypothetical protein
MVGTEETRSRRRMWCGYWRWQALLAAAFATLHTALGGECVAVTRCQRQSLSGGEAETMCDTRNNVHVGVHYGVQCTVQWTGVHCTSGCQQILRRGNGHLSCIRPRKTHRNLMGDILFSTLSPHRAQTSLRGRLRDLFVLPQVARVRDRNRAAGRAPGRARGRGSW